MFRFFPHPVVALVGVFCSGLVLHVRASQNTQLVRKSAARVTHRAAEFRNVPAEPVEYLVQVHRTMTHQNKPWTQALEFSPQRKYLIETSGSYPPGMSSNIRILNPQTGAVLRQVTSGLEAPVFVEGLVHLNGLYYVTTYHDQKVVVYNSSFGKVREYAYPLREGWGLTRAPGGQPGTLLVTNGSEWLTTLAVPGAQAVIQDSRHAAEQGMSIMQAKKITCFGMPVYGVNELEMVDNFQGRGPTLFGNVMNSRLVVLLDPQTAQCTGVFSIAGDMLEPVSGDEAQGFHAANGIAYNAATGHFIITGKNWGGMYEISLQPKSSTRAASASNCLKQFVELGSNAGSSVTQGLLNCR